LTLAPVTKPIELRATKVITSFQSALAEVPYFVEEKPAHEAEKNELNEELCRLVCVE
jgi:hypothetical protein